MAVEAATAVASVAADPARDEVMDAKAGVTIVIPAYNEEPGVASVLKELLAQLDQSLSTIAVEVIVVDDGSTDATAEQVLSVGDDRIKIVRHPHNRGYGAAIKTGVQHAGQPWVLITDADGTYPNEFIGPLLELRDAYDMIVGARTGATSKIPLVRRPAKWVLRHLAAYLAREEIPDLNSGLRVMRRDLFLKYAHLLPDGFSLTTTITLTMFSGGNRIHYLPINYLARKGASKIRPVADTLNFVMLILRTISYFEPLRIFVPLALGFLVASAVVGAAGYYFFGRILDGTIVILFVTGVHMLGLGIVADMLSRRFRS